MDNTRLIEILRENRGIKKVTVQRSKDTSEFWDSFSNEVYYLDDWTLSRSAIINFKDNDDLSLVNKSGKLLKRFSKYIKKNYDIQLSNELMGKIGDILQRFVQNQANEFFIDFTDTFDWRNGQFGKSGSCWWGTYSESLPTFENGGGWVIRFYNSENQCNDNGIGRTWLYPENGYLIGFNSYGVGRPQVSKVIKALFAEYGIELHYKRIEVENNYSDTIPYINGGTGFVLGEDVTDIESWDLNMEVEDDDEHFTCEGCGLRYHTDDSNYVNDYLWCNDCYNDRFAYCQKCGEDYDNDYVHEVNHRYSYMCEDCLSDCGFYKCEDCGEYSDNVNETDECNLYCEDCIESHAFYCEDCEQWLEGVSECEEHKDEEDEEEEEYKIPANVVCNIEDITIVTNISNNKTSKVQTWRIEGINGLFTYKHSDVFTDDSNLFCVTHEQSGLRLHSKKLTLEQAINFMLAVCHINFDRSQDEVLKHSQEILDIRTSQGIY